MNKSAMMVSVAATVVPLAMGLSPFAWHQETHVEPTYLKMVPPEVVVPTPSAPDLPPPILRPLRNGEASYAITQNAQRILEEHGSDPIGTEYPFTVKLRSYVGRIERHFHEPGGEKRPWGYHTGVSVYAVVQ